MAQNIYPQKRWGWCKTREDDTSRGMLLMWLMAEHQSEGTILQHHSSTKWRLQQVVYKTFTNYRRFPCFIYHLSFTQDLPLLSNVIPNARAHIAINKYMISQVSANRLHLILASHFWLLDHLWMEKKGSKIESQLEKQFFPSKAASFNSRSNVFSQ